ncbi:GAF domain-containing protein [Mucilaginibacter galii]|uniref:GAF domain-containing protein n=1 Tax=Mucilaginibacter galii TaxID=2005073 RepID=A0A917JBR8_9SPHI|nr:GAF domain-containing protein [Mucilaginibacter galii]GGI51702.1 hypothetical protein GCM10011425_29140 [Mucilaginibacter galii]
MSEKERDRLATVNRFLQMKITNKDELQQIVELAAKICETPIAMITFMDDETQHIRFKMGAEIQKVPYQDTFCQHTISQKDLLVITDALADERVKENHFVVNKPSLRFYAGATLTTQDEHNMGTLCVYDTQPKVLSSLQEKMLLRLGKQVMRLLEFDASLQLLKDQYESSIMEETKLRSFFESSSSCHLLLDKELAVHSFNKAMVNVLRSVYEIELAEGMPMTDYVETEFLDEFKKNCQSALLGEIVSVDSLVDSPIGKMAWHLTYEPALDASGAIVGVSYSATDITQTMHHKKTVIDQMESFRQIDRILSAELHQPLDAVMEAMSCLKQKGYPAHITEFSFLEKAFDELSQKRKNIF